MTNTHDLTQEELDELHDAIVDALEAATIGCTIGEVTVLKTVPRMTKTLLRVRKPAYVLAKIDVNTLRETQHNALVKLGWSHRIPLQDTLAFASLASIVGLFTGGLGWIVGGFAAGITAMQIDKMPHWVLWESASGSFDYDAIAALVIETNHILLDGGLDVLRIDPITPDDKPKKKKKR